MHKVHHEEQTSNASQVRETRLDFAKKAKLVKIQSCSGTALFGQINPKLACARIMGIMFQCLHPNSVTQQCVQVTALFEDSSSTVGEERWANDDDDDEIILEPFYIKILKSSSGWVNWERSSKDEHPVRSWDHNKVHVGPSASSTPLNLPLRICLEHL